MSEHGEDEVVELAPCPFCGNGMDSFAGMTPDAFAKCSDGTLLVNCDCGATGPSAPTMAGAVSAWNRRTCNHKPGDRLPGGLVCVPGKTIPLPETRKCEVCGRPISVGKFAKRRNTKTCSATCRFRKWQKSHAASTD